MRVIVCFLAGMLFFSVSVDSEDVELGSVEPGEKAEAEISYTFQSDESPPPVYRISFQGESEIEDIPCLAREETNLLGQGLGNYDEIELRFDLVVRGIREVSFFGLSASELLEKDIVMKTSREGVIEVSIGIETEAVSWANDAGEYHCSLTIVFSKVNQQKGERDETRKKRRKRQLESNSRNTPISRKQ